MLNRMNINPLSSTRKRLFSALLITVMSTPLAVTAGIYKWTDEQGNVHYGSQRPEDATAERMKIESDKPPATEKNAAKDTGKEPKKEGEAEKKPEAVPPKAAVEPKISKKEKQRLCQQARGDMQTIEARGRVREMDESGNTRYLTDQERTKRLSATRADVNKYCK